MTTAEQAQQIFEDLERHIKLFRSRKIASEEEEEKARADRQRREEILPSTDISFANLITRFGKEYTILENDYQEKKSALDRDYNEKTITLEAAIKTELTKISNATEARQRDGCKEEHSSRMRKAARKVQENLAKNDWVSLRSRIEVSIHAELL